MEVFRKSCIHTSFYSCAEITSFCLILFVAKYLAAVFWRQMIRFESLLPKEKTSPLRGFLRKAQVKRKAKCCLHRLLLFKWKSQFLSWRVGGEGVLSLGIEKLLWATGNILRRRLLANLFAFLHLLKPTLPVPSPSPASQVLHVFHMFVRP